MPVTCYCAIFSMHGYSYSLALPFPQARATKLHLAHIRRGVLCDLLCTDEESIDPSPVAMHDCNNLPVQSPLFHSLRRNSLHHQTSFLSNFYACQLHHNLPLVLPLPLSCSIDALCTTVLLPLHRAHASHFSYISFNVWPNSPVAFHPTSSLMTAGASFIDEEGGSHCRSPPPVLLPPTRRALSSCNCLGLCLSFSIAGEDFSLHFPIHA